MKIEHVSIWVNDLEEAKTFYEKYFGATAGEKYFNPKNHFVSYFLRFTEGARLEIMSKPGIRDQVKEAMDEFFGLAHIAISVGSKEKVNELTNQLREDGFRVIGAPRTTGDGYYESVVMDREGNRIEITI